MEIIKMEPAERLLSIRRNNLISGIRSMFSQVFSTYWLTFPESQAVLYQSSGTYRDVRDKLDQGLFQEAKLLTVRVLRVVSPSYALHLEDSPMGFSYNFIAAAKDGLFVINDELDSIERLNEILMELVLIKNEIKPAGFINEAYLKHAIANCS